MIENNVPLHNVEFIKINKCTHDNAANNKVVTRLKVNGDVAVTKHGSIKHANRCV